MRTLSDRARVVGLVAMAVCVAGASVAMAGYQKDKEEDKGTDPFDQRGVIVAVHTFFDATKPVREAQSKPLRLAREKITDRVLVTERGVYTFLETPHNFKLLAKVKPGDTVDVKGKVHRKSFLLHATRIDPVKVTAEAAAEAQATEAAGDPATDGTKEQPKDKLHRALDRYKVSEPVRVVMTGTNKCQCGLSTGDLPNSCRLGHIHHFESNEGKIYHYLQYGDGGHLLRGNRTHLKVITLDAMALPGNYLLINAARLK